MLSRRSTISPILHKRIIMKTLQNKHHGIKTLQAKSRPSPDLVQTKSRLNMPFLNTLILFRTQGENPHVRGSHKQPDLRLKYVSRA